ncbi:MAG TPA: hypothetical protein VG847_16925 [Chitinophagaceae bacterium]|nr:hypothetical protein [Chitinophagaceae bacterium]
MKKVIAAIFILIIVSGTTPPHGSIDVLQKMHDRFQNKWYKTFSFNQTTELYKNDSLQRSQVWYENIKFPGRFRIDFGSPDSGNAVIFKNDSSYVFRKFKKTAARPYDNDLLFLLGGMYFYPFEQVISKMKSYGYDLDKYHEDTWEGKEVYVIGAKKNEDSVNQVWIEKENYSPVRFIKWEGGSKEEGLFENHVPLDGGFTETLVYFYISNKLVQVEKYHDLKANQPMDDAIFDTNNLVKLNTE